MKDSVRVVVVGDSGVGKSTLVHQWCTGEVLKTSKWTVGCSVQIGLHSYPGTAKSPPGSYVIEYFDVGGAAKYEVSRSVFYHSIDGVILVHDLSNRKSHSNLSRWLNEIALAVDEAARVDEEPLEERIQKMPRSPWASWFNDPAESSVPVDVEHWAGAWPILVIGNKSDYANSGSVASPATSRLIDQLGVDSIETCGLEESFEPGSELRERLDSFLNTVIERRHFPTSASTPTKTRKPTNFAHTLAAVGSASSVNSTALFDEDDANARIDPIPFGLNEPASPALNNSYTTTSNNNDSIVDGMYAGVTATTTSTSTASPRLRRQ